MMGEFEAEFPDRSPVCNQSHVGSSRRREAALFGFTAYAVRLLQDVYFPRLGLRGTGCDVQLGQEIGSIESKKAESALYAPLAGNLIEFNEVLMDDPSAINTDK